MALYKNFTVGSLPGSGLLLTTGMARHDVAIAVAAAIVSASGGQWVEVTGAGPTPAALQPFASTGVTAGGTTTMIGSGTMRHITLYDTLDPALALATPRARMIRIGIATHSLTLAILDLQSAQGAVTDDTRWSVPVSSGTQTITATYMSKHNSLGTNGQRGDHFISFMPASTSLSPVNTANLLTDQRVYIAGDDDWLFVRCERVSDGELAGEAHIMLFDEPADGHWTRATRPSIMEARFSGNTVAGSSLYVAVQQHLEAPGTTAWGARCFTRGDFNINGYGMGMVPDNLAPDGKLPLIKHVVYSDTGSGVNSSFMGVAPGYYASYNHASVAKWNTVTIGAEVYTCMCNNGWAIWVRTT